MPLVETQRISLSGAAARIRTARTDANLTQRQLAAKLAVSAGAVAKWETGGSRPATERLGDLASVLNVSVDWLIGTPAASKRADRMPPKDRHLLEEARRLGVDLAAVVSEARQRHWLAENRGAIEDANGFLDRHGLWSDGKRLF